MLHESEMLMRRLKDVSNTQHSFLLFSLQIVVEDCRNDVYEWVRKAGKALADFVGSAMKRTFERLLAGINKEDI